MELATFNTARMILETAYVQHAFQATLSLQAVLVHAKITITSITFVFVPLAIFMTQITVVPLTLTLVYPTIKMETAFNVQSTTKTP
jgi:hypothetical protein